jgi:glycosyltransferase involved in cell wall biosynthesis
MKKSNEKVSLIVPFYNAAKTLDRCISSILAQTYTNFELIAVDDGSLDASCEVVNKYAAADSRVILLKKEHAGVSAARNAGIEAASGGYIQFIDADDDVEPDMLQVMLGELKRTGADIAVCNFTHPSIKNYLGNRVLDLTRHVDMMTYYQQTFAVQVPWNKLYRRKVITELYDVDVSFCEDGLFGLANMKNARRIVSTDRKLYHYYVAPQNTSAAELSCINKIAKADNFWETHETYWYKQAALLEKTKRILDSRYTFREAEDLLYIRVFDFLLWEILILGDMGISRYGLIKEAQSVLRDPRFIKSISVKEKYGILFRSMTDEELDLRAAEFVDLLLFAIKDIKEKSLPHRHFYIALSLFAALFVEDRGAEDGSVDFLAQALVDYRFNLTDEAEYVRGLIESDEIYDTAGELSPGIVIA